MTPPEWRVETRDSIGAGANDGTSVPLKWAHDAETGAARYIHDTEVVDERHSRLRQTPCRGLRNSMLAAGRSSRLTFCSRTTQNGALVELPKRTVPRKSSRSPHSRKPSWLQSFLQLHSRLRVEAFLVSGTPTGRCFGGIASG